MDDEYYESQEEMLDDDFDEDDEDVGIMESPEDGLNMVLVIFTTIFLLIGIGLMFYELSSAYEGWGSAPPKSTRR